MQVITINFLKLNLVSIFFLLNHKSIYCSSSENSLEIMFLALENAEIALREVSSKLDELDIELEEAKNYSVPGLPESFTDMIRDEKTEKVEEEIAKLVLELDDLENKVYLSRVKYVRMLVAFWHNDPYLQNSIFNTFSSLEREAFYYSKSRLNPKIISFRTWIWASGDFYNCKFEAYLI